MADAKQLKASAREKVGKGAARATRLNKQIPAVIYGGGEPPLAISLDQKQATHLILAGHFLTTVFDIDVDGKTIRALPRDYQMHPVRDNPLHVDFLRLSAGQTVRVFVPVHFINQDISPGIKKGGSLNVVRHEVEFVVPGEAIPESITVDLAHLDISENARISSVALPQGVKPVIKDRDFVIANIAPPKTEAEAPAAAAAAPAAAPAAAAAKAAAKPAAKK